MIKVTILELLDKNSISYKTVDCSKDDFLSLLPISIIQYLNCMGKTIYLNKTVYGSAYTTLFSVDEIKKEQNINKATKVMMDMQKPLKKFYEKKNSKITKTMVDELLKIAKNNKENTECAFLKEYLK